MGQEADCPGCAGPARAHKCGAARQGGAVQGRGREQPLGLEKLLSVGIEAMWTHLYVKAFVLQPLVAISADITSTSNPPNLKCCGIVVITANLSARRLEESAMERMFPRLHILHEFRTSVL